MVVEPPDEQTTKGNIISSAIKYQGHSNKITGILGFVMGGFAILLGMFLELIFASMIFLILSGVGLIIILISWLALKFSKPMTEGKYYSVGKGWVNPK